MSRNLLSEYEERIVNDRDVAAAHSGSDTFLNDLYHPVNQRTIKEYFDDLITHTNTRILLNPFLAVGGHWGDAGADQLTILRSVGLQPSNTVLDVGCGTLRAGKWIIHYLDSDCYTGIDISSEAINYANQLASRFQSEWGKSFDLILNEDPAQNNVIPLPEEQKFDFITSFWTCYDMPEEIFRQFLHEAIDRMHSDSVFVFSWYPSDSDTRLNHRKMFQWLHSHNVVKEVVKEHGVEYSDLSISLHRFDEQIVSLIEPGN